MSDPRQVEARCHSRWNGTEDMLRRFDARCIFRNGHPGLHAGNRYYENAYGLDAEDERPDSLEWRWGTQEELAAELDQPGLTGDAPPG